MSNLIKNNFDILRVLADKKNLKTNKFILKTNEKNLYKAISECVLNVQKEIIQLSDESVRNLKPYKKTIKTLSDKKISLSRKKNLLKKTGVQFLPLVLPPVLKYLSFLSIDVAEKDSTISAK